MEERESNERKNLLIRTIIIIILLLLAFLSTILYVYLYPKTKVYLYDMDYTPIRTFEVKKYSTLESLPDMEKSGYTFKYWTYDDFEINGGAILNKDAELTTDTLSLYANYQANKYRVTYHVQYFNEVTGQYEYKTYIPPRNTYPEVYEYGSRIDSLPTGRDAFNNLLPDFSSKAGYHFVGWTTRVVSEDDPTAKDCLTYAGQEFIIDIPSDIDFYAYFEKNQYTINLHTGIEYQLDGSGNPLRDSSGEYIIKNISNDPNNDRESLLTDKVRYMDSLVDFASNYLDITLNETNAGMAYGEYEFKGWYLDADYTLPIANQALELQIMTNGHPYYEYVLSDGTTKIVLARDTGRVDGDDNVIYEFDIYSKWQRIAYEINFSKNSNSSNGKIEPIHLFKVFLDEQGIIIDEYGKYYNDGEFTYEGYANGGHYSKVNLETLDVVSQAFRDSNKNYRLVGWTDSISTKDENTTWYALWQQDPWTEVLGQNRITGIISYSNSVYIHTLSENRTLYAQWSKVYIIKFAYAQGNNQKHFEYSGIEGEWFILPNMADINRITGSDWTKKYNYFAGWTTGTSSLATKYLEKLTSGENNPNYKYTIGRASTTLIVLWQKTPYTVKFYLNDNNDSSNGGSVFDTYAPVYGGTYKYFPKNPTREGYIFDGWSKTDYTDNEYSTNKRKVRDNIYVDSFEQAYTSASNFLIDNNMAFYASWTRNFVVEYDGNGGTFAGNATTKYTYAELGASNLKINLYVGSGLKSLAKENYIFKGWKLQTSNGVADKLIKTNETQKTTFDFLEIDGKYYYYDYRADGITVPENEKTEMTLIDGYKVVLVAVWEPKKYNVTIKDTRASGDKTATQITITVAFNEPFTFPDKNALGEPLDNKLGYKLVGFARTEGGEVAYAIDAEGNYPVIEANIIDRNLTFYTVYEQKTIRVEYKAKMPDGETILNFDEFTKSVDYGAVLTMPMQSQVEFMGKILKFKYWYYEKDGVEVRIATGDKASYHNADNVLVIYGQFEAESYDVTIGLTNPFNNASLITTTFALPAQEKDSEVTTNLYDEVMAQVYEKLNAMLSDYMISNGIYKGYTLLGLYATGGYDDKFEAGKVFNSTDFRILGFTTSGMTLATRWSASNVDIVYSADEEGIGESKIDTVKFSDSPINLKDNSYIAVTGGKVIKSWYVKDGENKVFFDCSSILVGVGSKYGYNTLNAMQKYITWDENGRGTIKIYANTEQTCNVEYYTFDGSAPISVFTQSFVFGDDVSMQLGDIAKIGMYADSDLLFEGWYLDGHPDIKFIGGQSIDALRTYLTADNSYTIRVYANLTFVKTIYYVKVSDNAREEELLSSETISLLKYNEESGKFFYINSIILNSYPELTDDQIPSGYNYYGLRFGDNTYKKETISGSGVAIPITGENIKLVTYYTKEYTITYRVIDGATFEDGSAEDKVEKYLIGIDDVVVGGDIKIKYSAKKTGYDGCFAGWQVMSSNGNLSTEKYILNAKFVPQNISTILVPAFDTPDAGTINAKIVLIKESGSTDTKEYEYWTAEGKPTNVQTEKRITNGDRFVFTGSNGASDIWTSLSRDLYKWVGEDGKEYSIGEIFTIPVAITSGQTFTFTGVWIEKYTVKFNQPAEFAGATGYDASVTLHRGEEYVISQTPVVYVDGALVEGVEFKYWIYNNNGTEEHIKLGDSIVLNKDGVSGYKYIGNADGSGTHYLPSPAEGSNGYTLLGAWDTVTYNITLVVVSPDDSREYTLYLYGVPFGTTIDSRAMLDSSYIYLLENGVITSDNLNNLNSILALENENRGIVGWTKTKGNTTADSDALTSIKESTTLYAVWQTKYSLGFASASESTDFDYNQTISASRHLPTEEIDVNNVIKNIYAKGYSTVYLEGGKWIIINASGNDYYIVTGFTSNVTLQTKDGNVTTLSIDGNGRVPTFSMPASNVTLTPVLDKIYKVTFCDNSNEGGGDAVVNTEGKEKYLVFARSGEEINLSTTAYNTTRTNFTFVGWNTSKDSDSAIQSISIGNENVNVYAIWASNRRAKFQISLSSSSGITNRTLLEMPLTKDNKVNASIIDKYLNGETITSSNVKVYGNLDKIPYLSSLGHLAYVYNFNNYLLDGYIVSRNSGNATLSLEDLIAENFGNSSEYNLDEDITITFNLFDIFTITYATSASDVEGTINEPDYFVSNKNYVGKLVEKTTENPSGIVSELVLPTPSVTRIHYAPSMWANEEILSANTIKYSLTTTSDLTLNTSKLNSLATALRNKYTQEYKLYVIWEYELINTYVYAVADVIDTSIAENADKSETTLVAPYNAYLNGSSDGSTIDFANVPNIITINDSRLISVGNWVYNGINPSIAQLRYNDVFQLGRAGINYNVGGFTLVGFSTTLYKLGQKVDSSNYFKLNTDIVLDESLINENAVTLYPVYEYETKTITVQAVNGDVSVTSRYFAVDSDGNELTSATCGYVYIDDMPSEQEYLIKNNDENGKKIDVNVFTKLYMTADSPLKSYTFDSFTSNIKTEEFIKIDATYSYKGVANMSILYNVENYSNDNVIFAVYSASRVKVKVSLTYANELKNGYTDNGVISFTGLDSEGSFITSKLDNNTRTINLIESGITRISYNIDTRSDYYDYELYSDGKLITLADGKYIDVSSLKLSEDKDADGYYSAEINVIAQPKSYTVSFIMNRGQLNSDARINATNNIYDGITSFAIVGGSAKVFMGSLITLPTASDITYSRGKFIKFYLNGDTNKNEILTYTITQDTVFVEEFDDNAFTIQYVYMGNVKFVSGIAPNTDVTIGIDEARTIAGYSLKYWTFENGEKAFEDGAVINITKSYILYGYYEGNEITYRYNYTGGSIDVVGYNGEDIMLLDPATINNATHAENLYIYGWSYNGNIWNAPNKITFAELGYTYSSDNTVIVFSAEYLGKYTYQVQYNIDNLADGDLTNASQFALTTHYVRKSTTGGYNESDLKVKVSEITPLYEESKHLYFDKYNVEYSIDGGNTWIISNQDVRVGGVLTMCAPIDDSTTIMYRLTPTFVSNYASITVDYNLTNPDDGSNINDLTTTTGSKIADLITNITFNTGLSFGDNYLLNISATAGSNTATFAMAGKTISFDLQITSIDWFEYILVGYNVELYSGETLKATREFRFGGSDTEDRNLAGNSRAVLTPIWQKKYVINYFNQSGNTIYKDYVDYSADIETITLQSRFVTTEDNLTLSGYACVGWTKNSDNNHIILDVNEFIKFGGDIAVSSDNREINLYPAQSKIYKINFVTTGIDSDDESNFVLSTIDAPSIYLGINDNSTIDMANYSFDGTNYIDYADIRVLYNSYDNDKYSFLGFASSADGEYNSTYTFDSNAISGDTITAYVVWSKNEYDITFVFEAYANGGTDNLLDGYTFNVSKYYADEISFDWQYDKDKNYFDILADVKVLDSWISNIKNSGGVSLEEKINTILEEKGINYLSTMKFTHIVAGVVTEINVNELLTIVGKDTIKITFESPIYRLSYTTYYGSKYKGESVKENIELHTEIIALGDNLTPTINISDVTMDGFQLDFWSADKVNNFFVGNSHTVASEDLQASALTQDYKLVIYPHFVTEYQMNFYYFASLEDLINYQDAVENNDSNPRRFYTQLGSTLDVKVDDTIGLYQKDASGNLLFDENNKPIKIYRDAENKLQATIFDEYLKNNTIEIVLDKNNNIKKRINNFVDFYTVFADYQYTTEGELNINDDKYSYMALELEDGHTHSSIYSVMSYGTGTELVNNVYLTYETITHNATFVGAVVSENNNSYTFDSNKSSQYNVYAEYAINVEQLNDNGSGSVGLQNMRNLANTINADKFNAETLSYRDRVYLINQPYFVRGGLATSDSFEFAGWGVLVESGTEGEYTISDISAYGLTITPVRDGNTNVIKYWEVSGISSDIKFVAMYTERMIDVTVNLSSADENADNLRLELISYFGNLNSDYSDLEESITVDTSNHTTTYNIKVLYNSWLSVDVHKDLTDSYKISKIKLGSYETDTSMSIAINEDNMIEGKVTIDVEYSQFTYSLLIKVDETIDTTRYVGNLEKINYTIGALNVSSDVQYTGNEFAYVCDLPIGARLDGATLGTPTLNNYTFMGWQYLNNSNAWVDLNVALASNIVNDNKEIYIRALFEANSVNIKYVIEEYLDGNTIQNEITDLSATVTYGDTLTLPYVIIESDTYITNGWDVGAFGSKVKIVSNNNELLDTYYIKAKLADIYYVQFDAGNTKFTLPSDYPTAKTNNNKIVSNTIEIPANTKYYYNFITGSDIVAGTQKTANASTIIRSNSYVIPSAEIASVDGVAFDSWTSKLSKSYKLGDTYTYIKGDEEDNLVILTAVASNHISVKFYITSPVDNSIMQLTTKVGTAPSIDYITLLIDNENNNKYIDVDYNNSNEQYININAMNAGNIDVAYFIESSAKDDYKFYGWSTEKVNTFTNIFNLINSADNFENNGSKYFSYYTMSADNVCTKKAHQILTSELSEFIAKSGVLELYAIWEQKYEVKFVDDNGSTIASAKYGNGEFVDFPNPTTTTLTNGLKKWIGWQSDNQIVEFVNDKASIYFVGTDNVTFTPLWQDGYTLTLDTNFDRDAVSQIFAKYGQTTDDILAGMGYPFFAESNSMLTPTGTTVTINSLTYSSAYLYGTLWTEGQKIDLSSSSLRLVDNYTTDGNIVSIYPTTLGLSQATWLNSYYTFAGWSLTPDGDVLLNSELQNFTIQGKSNTTLYAIWTPIELNVYLCGSVEDAENAEKLTPNNAGVTNPIKIKFGDSLNIADYQTESYIENYTYLISQKGKRFKEWNVILPLTKETLNVSGLQVINNLYLYPEYNDEYTVIFKTAKGQIVAGQGTNLENCQKVIDGEDVKIKDYITNTLGQNVDLITSIYYFNNSGNIATIDGQTSSIRFNSEVLSAEDKANKTFTITIDVNFNVELYAPTSSTDNTYTRKSVISITPDFDITVKSGSNFSEEYNLDMSTYNNVPSFVGWYFFENNAYENDIYRVDDLANAIVRYTLTTIDGNYALVTYNRNSEQSIYNLSSTGLTIKLYAKLIVTEEITLGANDDDIIQKYAQLSVIEDQYVLVENSVVIGNAITGKNDVKTLVVTTAYGSPKEVKFTIATEGYIVDSITTNNNGMSGYVPQNDSLFNSQNFDTVEYLATMSKATTTSKFVNDSVINGMYITYTFTIKEIRQNNCTFAIYITPYTFEAVYSVDSSRGMLRTADGAEFTSTAINMLADVNIYQKSTNSGIIKAYESNSVILNYTYTEDSGNATIKFISVPYGMKISITYLPNEEMHRHFDSLLFSWDSTVWYLADANAQIKGVDINITGQQITYRPVENDSSTFRTSYATEVIFVENSIKNIELYLDFENTDVAGNTAWTNVLGKTIADNHTKSITEVTKNGYTYNRYAILWEVGASDVLAGDDLTSLFVEWKNNFHTEFENSLSSANLNDSTITLNTLINFFWLEDSKNFQTYSKDISEKSGNGYLGTTNYDSSANKIYSLNGGTVQLHIELSRAMLISASSRTVDYVNNNQAIDIKRAQVSLNASSEILTYSNNNKFAYVNDTLVDSLLVKMPYENSKVTFSTTPATATDNHVAYKLSKWSAIDGGTVDTSEQNTQMVINTNIANNNIKSMFAKFGSIDMYQLPEIHLRGDVVAQTYKVNFLNSDNSNITSFDIAYDSDIANIIDASGAQMYPYYQYSLASMHSANSYHILPRFTLDVEDGYRGIKFVHPDDEINAAYGELKNIFKHWSQTNGGSIYVNDWLIANKITDNSGAVSGYRDVNLYACFESAIKITFVRYASPDNITCELYLADTGFTDQFGNAYDNSLLSKSYAVNSSWLLTVSNATIDASGNYEYYLKGTSNFNNIQVRTLSDIQNAYRTQAGNLMDADEYIVYPKMVINLTVYKHRTDNRYRSEKVTYATLGGKITFVTDGEIVSSNYKYNSKDLLLSNVILDTNNVALERLQPTDYTDYSFGVWFVGNTNVAPNEQVSTLTDANIYPHYNIKASIQNSTFGTSNILAGDGNRYEVGEWLQLLDSPSNKVITAGSDNLRINIGIWYETSAKDESGFTYGILKIVDRINNTTLYTIKYVANETYFDRIAFNIITQNGTSKILSLAGAMTIVDSYVDIEDNAGSYQIYPVAYPKNVTLTIDNFAVVNIPNESQFSSSITKSTSSLVVEGGAQFIFSSESKAWNINFRSVLGDMLSESIKMTALASFDSNNLGSNLQSFRWQYKKGSKWIDCGSDMRALESMNIRLVANWIEYSATFEKMNEQPANVTQVKIGNSYWDIKDNEFNDYTITDGTMSGGNYVSIENFVMFKGESLKYDYASQSFVLNSSFGTRNGKIIKIATTLGYVQGFALKTTSGKNITLNGLLENAEYTNSNVTFVAWVEASKSVNVLVDKDSDYTYGYGDVGYDIVDPMNKGNVTGVTLAINKNSKRYGNAFTVGMSSKVTIYLNENNSVNHDLVSIKYNIDGSIDKIGTEALGTQFSGIYGSNLRIDIQVLFDAEPTRSTYTLVYKNNQIITYNSGENLAQYVIYGGYNLTYTLANKILTTKITDYWGSKSNEFKVYLNANSASYVNNYYPRTDYFVGEINLHKVSEFTSSGNKIISDIGSSDNICNESSLKKSAQDYNGDKSMYIMRLDEYVHSITLSYTIKTGVGTSFALSKGLAYIDNNGTDVVGDTTRITGIARNNANAFMQYNMTRLGVLMSISDKFSGIIKAGSEGIYNYRLQNVRITNSDGTVDKKVDYTQATIGDPIGSREEWNLEDISYNVTITLARSTTANIAFKLTLPYDEDLRNLKIYNTGITPTFNGGESDVIALDIGSKVRITNNGYTLSITSGNREYTLTINGGKSIYNLKGWYLDNSYNHLDNSRYVTKNIGGYDYQLLDFNAENEITTAGLLISGDATIVLSMDRAPVSIYVDNTSWSDMDKSDIAFSSTTAELQYLANNYTKPNTCNYLVPGGLVRLIPADINEDTYSRGSSIYLGCNNVDIPTVLKTNYRESKDGSKVFTLSVGREISINGSGKYSNSAYIVLAGDTVTNLYDIELTLSREWILVEYPAIQNSITVNFHEYARGESGGTTFTYNFLRSESLNMLSSYRTYSQTTTVYTERQMYSRLYKDMNGIYRSTMPSNFDKTRTYNLSAVDFTCSTTMWNKKIANGADVYIDGFEVISKGSSTTTSVINLSNYTDTIDVYPIFTETRKFTITIEGPFDSMATSYEVIEGTYFDWSYDLPYVNMTVDSAGGTGSRRTIESNRQILVGLYDCKVLDITSSGVYQINNNINLHFMPTSDMVISASMVDLKNITILYECEDYDSYENLSFSRLQSADYSRVPSGLIISDDTNSVNLGDENDYFSANNFRVIINNQLVRYSLFHWQHQYRLAGTEYDGCYEYFKNKCIYCGHTILGSKTGNAKHGWTDGEWGAWTKFNDSQHYRSRYCPFCGEEDRQYGNHKFGRPYWISENSQHKKVRECSDCNYQQVVEGTLGYHTRKNVYVYKDATYHKSNPLCDVCGLPYWVEGTFTHNWVNDGSAYWGNNSGGACNDTKYQDQKCKDCAGNRTIEVASGTQHSFETHKNNKMHWDKCTRCGYVTGKSVHSFTTTTYATCTTQGEQKCYSCGFTQSTPKDSSNHDYQVEEEDIETSLKDDQICYGYSGTGKGYYAKCSRCSDTNCDVTVIKYVISQNFGITNIVGDRVYTKNNIYIYAVPVTGSYVEYPYENHEPIQGSISMSYIGVYWCDRAECVKCFSKIFRSYWFKWKLDD